MSPNPYLGRKFILAMLFTIAGCLALFLTDKVSGGEFVTLAGLILGSFTAGDVAMNAIHRKTGGVPDP